MNAISIIIFMFALILCAAVEKRLGNLHNGIHFILVIIFSILVAIRPTWIPDTEAYINIFHEAEATFGSYISMSRAYDTGFMAFLIFVKSFLKQNVRFFFFAICFLNSYLMIFAIRKINALVKKELSYINVKKKDFIPVILFFMMYISYFGFFYNSIVIRTSLALSFIFCMVAYTLENKTKTGILFLIIAGLFHYSAFILGAIIFFVLKKKKLISRQKLFGFWIIIGIIWLSGFSSIIINIAYDCLGFLIKIGLVYKKYQYYLDEIVQYNGAFALKNIFFYACGLFFLWPNIKSKVYNQLLQIYFIGLLIIQLSNSFIIAYRITDYFIIFYIVLLFLLYNYNMMPKTNKRILTFIYPIIALLGVFMFLRGSHII